MSALKYNITAIVDGDLQDFPLTPEPLTAEEVPSVLLGRMKAMATQGYWRDGRGEAVGLKYVNYVVTVAEPEEEEEEGDE